MSTTLQLPSVIQLPPPIVRLSSFHQHGTSSSLYHPINVQAGRCWWCSNYNKGLSVITCKVRKYRSTIALSLWPLLIFPVACCFLVVAEAFFDVSDSQPYCLSSSKFLAFDFGNNKSTASQRSYQCLCFSFFRPSISFIGSELGEMCCLRNCTIKS